MKKLNTFLIVSFCALFLTACAGNQKAIIKYRELLQKKDLKSALEMMKGDSIYSDEQSRLLKYLELGTLHLHGGEYYQALLNFDKARDLSDKLFTVSISKKIAGTIGNESSDNYSGEKFERSLIRYYSILCHYNLYEKGEYEPYLEEQRDEKGKIISTKQMPSVVLDDAKKRFHLTAAKATLIEWNAILEDYKKTSAGEVTYKDDLIAKFIGAVIHEKTETPADRQIALALIKESKNTVLKYYNSYQSFNLKYNDFNKDYGKLPNLKPEQLLSSYVSPTPINLNLTSYADELIKNWNKPEKDKDNVYIVWNEGLIASKEVKKYEFPIGLTAARVTVGTVNDFVSFAAQALVVTDIAAPKIAFELPHIPYRLNNDDIKLIIKKDGTTVSEKNGLLLDPLSEMAFHTLDAKAAGDLTLKGTRVAAKHLTALLASYATYKSLKEKMGDGFALLSGIAGYNIASRGIEESEKADLRSWISLPNQVRMSSFKLSPGNYELYSLNVNVNAEVLIGKFTVSDKEKIILKSFF